jgi:hypothetical protein
MFKLFVIPKNKPISKQYFKELLVSFSPYGEPGALMTCLGQIFKNNQNYPNFLVSTLDLLLVQALKRPHVYDFCKNIVPDSYWQVELEDLGLVFQPGFTRFELLWGVALYKDAFEKAGDNEVTRISALKEVVAKTNSFPALLALNDYYQWRLRCAISEQCKIKDVPEMYREIFLGKEHGTPAYVLLASLCFDCAQYNQEVKKDDALVKVCYQLAIQHLICAHQIRDFSQAAITNAFYIDRAIPNYKDHYGEANFFHLLTLVKEGKVEVLLDKIRSISALKSSEIDLARNSGLIAAEKFVTPLRNYEQPVVTAEGTNSSSLVLGEEADRDTRFRLNP